MTLLALFLIAFAFSFIGSIPPGIINVSVMQYAMQGKKNAAISFAIAAGLTEYIYAGIAVRFQIFLTSHESITEYFQLVSGSVLIILGVLNWFKKTSETKPIITGEKRNAFKKGVLIGFANPLAIPFWLMVTAFLQSMQWVVITHSNFWIYVAGVSCGTLALLLIVAKVGSRFSSIQNNHWLIYKLPGLLFIGMGLWSFLQT